MLQDGSGGRISSASCLRTALSRRHGAGALLQVNIDRHRGGSCYASSAPVCRGPQLMLTLGAPVVGHPLLRGAWPPASLLAISSPLYSLFKVLFIFPSRYLFAIGLLLIFSFRWSLPPALSCTRKQLDSSGSRRTGRTARARTGLSPSLAPHSMGVVPGAFLATTLQTTIRPARSPRQTDLHVELFPLHSLLLGESLLVSFPPLNNMLKSSGSSCLISGQRLRAKSYKEDIALPWFCLRHVVVPRHVIPDI